MVVEALHEILLLFHWFQVDHREIAALGEGLVLIEHVGDAAGHSRGKVPASLPYDDHDAAGHVLAAMVASALDHGHSTRIAHSKALAGDAAEVRLSRNRAVQHSIADDDRLLCWCGRLFRGADDDDAA